jgi:hypothetical protein
MTATASPLPLLLYDVRAATPTSTQIPLDRATLEAVRVAVAGGGGALRAALRNSSLREDVEREGDGNDDDDVWQATSFESLPRPMRTTWVMSPCFCYREA